MEWLFAPAHMLKPCLPVWRSLEVRVMDLLKVIGPNWRDHRWGYPLRLKSLMRRDQNAFSSIRGPRTHQPPFPLSLRFPSFRHSKNCLSHQSLLLQLLTLACIAGNSSNSMRREGNYSGFLVVMTLTTMLYGDDKAQSRDWKTAQKAAVVISDSGYSGDGSILRCRVCAECTGRVGRNCHREVREKVWETGRME